MLVAVNRYIEILKNSAGYTRTLGAVDVLMKDASGRPCCFVGNRSAVFKIRREGRVMMLKCYTCPKPNLRRIYGDRCLHDEIFIPCGASGEYVDAVLTEWVEGRSLMSVLRESAGDGVAMRRLAEEFDRFALELLEADWAHGDLKPENIIVDAGGVMHAIDFDAVYRPDLADLANDETGTAAFQHPLRTAEFYNKSIDDYPVALISTALHAMSLDTSLCGRFGIDEELLIDPREAVKNRSAALDAVLELFAARCMGVEYRIAQMLKSPVPVLRGLTEMMRLLVRGGVGVEDKIPRLAQSDGLWGYAVEGRFVIPPVFDCGFEFSEGLAAVKLGNRYHYISTDGRAVLSPGVCDAVKPFSGGRAVVIRGGERITIDRSGGTVDISDRERVQN